MSTSLGFSLNISIGLHWMPLVSTKDSTTSSETASEFSTLDVYLNHWGLNRSNDQTISQAQRNKPTTLLLEFPWMTQIAGLQQARDKTITRRSTFLEIEQWSEYSRSQHWHLWCESSSPRRLAHLPSIPWCYAERNKEHSGQCKVSSQVVAWGEWNWLGAPRLILQLPHIYFLENTVTYSGAHGPAASASPETFQPAGSQAHRDL